MGEISTGLLTYQDIRFIWPYGSVRLKQVKVNQQLGDHARLIVTGQMNPEQEDTIIQKSSSDDPVELLFKDENGKKQPLFRGQLYHVEVRHVHQDMYVTIEAISHTFTLDTQLKNRSFQQVHRNYTDIAQEVLSDYQGSDMLDEAFGKKPTGQFIMQYQETDWTFLKRLASHVGAVLVPNITAHRIQVWIGIPQGRRQIVLRAVPFRMRRQIAPYLNNAANGRANTSAEDYTSYTFEWPEMLQLGDEVKRSGLTYMVTKRTGIMTNGLMTWSYECVLPQGITIAKTYNETIIGAAIEGKILEVSRNQVRLHLDMDKHQNPKDAQWFPYSAEGNQVWYLMPEKGAQVKLYFPSANEDDAMVVQSVRLDPPSPHSASVASPKGVDSGSMQQHHKQTMADPGVKSFRNPQGKSFTLGDSELNMSAKEGMLYISMNASHGVSLSSTQSVQIQASGHLGLNAQSITLKGTEGLYVNTSSDAIELKEDVNALSSKIELKASTHKMHSPLASAFETQVAEHGLEQVKQNRMDANSDSRWKGVRDAATLSFIELLIDDVLGEGTADRFKYGADYPEEQKRHQIQYTKDLLQLNKSLDTVIDDAKQVGQSYVDPMVKGAETLSMDKLTTSADENYYAGASQYHGVTRVGETIIHIAELVEGVKSLKNIGNIVKSKKVPITEFSSQSSKQSSIPSAPISAGKFKTNSSIVPKPIQPLGGWIAQMGKKMDRQGARKSPFKFAHDGPDQSRLDVRKSTNGPHEPVTPERQKQIDALKSGEYTGKGSNGTGKPKTDYDKLKERLNERYKKFANDKKQNIPQTSKDLLPNELNHGKYGKLPNVTGDNITGHHMPSNKYMQDEFGIKTKDSYSMFLEHPHPGQGGRHRRTFTYGLSKATRPGDFTLYKSLMQRDGLAFDINDLRRILKEDGLYNKATRKRIQEYIDYYKNYEHNGLKIFGKPK
ncbi:Phage late control gene D protein (GPD) [compost metagenome]